MDQKPDIDIVKAKLVDALGHKQFLSACSDVIDQCGVLPTADALAELYNLSQLDVIGGFLSIEQGEEDFWLLDSLMYYTIRRCNAVDVEKLIALCSKMRVLEGGDLASGRLYDALEATLSNNFEAAKRSFEFSTQVGRPHDSLPCITRAYVLYDKCAPLKKLLELVCGSDDSELLLPALFSLQYCVVEDCETRESVKGCIQKFVEKQCDESLKRAAYLTSRAWGFSDIQNALMSQRHISVLGAVAHEIANDDDALSEEEFRDKLWCFLSVDASESNILDRLDYALQRQYERHPKAILAYVQKFINAAASKDDNAAVIRDIFPGLVRHFSEKLCDDDLMKILAALLVSESYAEQYLALRIASQIEIGRRIAICHGLDADLSTLPYLFRKTLGWLYGKKEACVPLLFGCVSKMSIAQFKAVEGLFYDPVCLHFYKEVEAQLENELQFCDKEVQHAIEGCCRRAKDFYAIFEINGPCNELHPTAEMRAIAIERQHSLMAEAHARAMKNSIMGLFSDNQITLLRGGKIIAYVKGEHNEFVRHECPIRSHSISWPVPKLLINNGSHVEDVLRILRMERLSK